VVEMGEASVVALAGDGQGIVPIAGKSAHIVTPYLDFDLGAAFEDQALRAMVETRILLARRDLLGVASWKRRRRASVRSLKAKEFSPARAGDRAKMPCWRALAAATGLPSVVRGPVEFPAWRRLASICLMEDIRLLN
jgi:hypothetical protein